jgi:hypothetical protein
MVFATFHFVDATGCCCFRRCFFRFVVFVFVVFRFGVVVVVVVVIVSSSEPLFLLPFVGLNNDVVVAWLFLLF